MKKAYEKKDSGAVTSFSEFQKYLRARPEYERLLRDTIYAAIDGRIKYTLKDIGRGRLWAGKNNERRRVTLTYPDAAKDVGIVLTGIEESADELSHETGSDIPDMPPSDMLSLQIVDENGMVKMTFTLDKKYSPQNTYSESVIGEFLEDIGVKVLDEIDPSASEGNAKVKIVPMPLPHYC